MIKLLMPDEVLNCRGLREIWLNGEFGEMAWIGILLLLRLLLSFLVILLRKCECSRSSFELKVLDAFRILDKDLELLVLVNFELELGK